MNPTTERPSAIHEGPADPGAAMHALVERLYPICRSITGEGVRRTLRIVQEQVPLDLREVPTGTPVLDWTVPKEWNIRDAYVKDASGERIVDFRASNLHVVSYSVPVHERMGLAELRPHLHTDPEHPEEIPYRTSYYDETWGFCLPHRQYEELGEGPYEVCVDSTLEEGALTYGEYVLEGETDEEVLFSCHVCHPSLCNDNLSGIALVAALARRLREREARRYTYRFLFVPGTIGSITWLSRNAERTDRIRHGLVVANVGDPGPMTYKRSRQGNAPVDRAAAHVLSQKKEDTTVQNFVPYGYDERQYCSPGFDLPVGSLTRTPYGDFPEYHTSADDLDFVRPEALTDSLETYLAVIDVLEHDRCYVNQNPHGEPQLGRRGLYDAIGGDSDAKGQQMAMLWVLNYSDGAHSLLDIARRADLPFSTVRTVAERLRDHDLLEERHPATEDGE